MFALLAVATSLFAGWNLRQHLTSEYKSKGSAIANSIASSSVEMLLNRDASTVQTVIDQYINPTGGVAYVFVVDDQGTIISHTFVPRIPVEVGQVTSGPREKEKTVVQSLPIQGLGNVIDISAPILAGVAGYVHVGMDQGVIETNIRTAIWRQVALISFIFVLSVVAAYLWVQQIARPLNRLTNYARGLATRAMDDASAPPRVDLGPIIQQRDEIGQLASALNHMVQQVSDREQSLKQALTDLHTRDEYFRALIENSSDLITILDQHGCIRYQSPSVKRVLGYQPDTLTGQPLATLLHPDDAPAATAALTASQFNAIDAPTVEFRLLHHDGSWRLVEAMRSQLRDSAGTEGIVITARDITERKRAEVERAQLQDEMIRVQAATLAELSTPMIPISDHIMVMPLIGAVDSARARQVLEALLQGIERNHVSTAIIDITGVPIIDTHVANTLIRVAQGGQLLGAHVVLTGMRPEVAQTLVGLGVSLHGLVTHASLQSGIAYAMASQQKRATSFRS